MEQCKELIIKEEYLPNFEVILQNLTAEDIIKFCNNTYNLQPSPRYIKTLFTKYKNNGQTQHLFSAIKHHLRNLYYNIDYNKFYSDIEIDPNTAMKIIQKHNDFNYPETIYDDFLNYFQK